MTLKIDVIKDKILSENYFVLRNITYDLTRNNGEVIRHKREVYDRGNGATILLYNREKQSVVLIRQFRVATWVNGNPDGRLIETCAGLLDDDEPEVCIRKEAVEETGFEVGEVKKVLAGESLSGSSNRVKSVYRLVDQSTWYVAILTDGKSWNPIVRPCWR